MIKLCFYIPSFLISSFRRGAYILEPRRAAKNLTRNVAAFHTSPHRYGLMEFFDDEDNWGAEEIRVGRSWKIDELRLKSNEDLHKLWFVLLKEKNMLLTMEHECKENYILFPNPERIDKVEESMQRLETVVRERNRAYHLLETGDHGERPIVYTQNQIGFPYWYKMSQHIIPKHLNRKWRKTHIFHFVETETREFLELLKEKEKMKKHAIFKKREHYVKQLLRRFDNLDPEAIKKHFPDVDLEKLKLDPYCQGHREVKYE